MDLTGAGMQKSHVSAPYKKSHLPDQAILDQMTSVAGSDKYIISMNSEPKFVSIAPQQDNKLRIYVSDAVLLEMQSLYIEFDIEALSLKPAKEPEPGKIVRKLTTRQQIYVSNIPDMARYIGKYEAIRRGDVWSLVKVAPAKFNKKESVEPNPGYPYRINFPRCEFVNGFFKML